MDPVKLYSTEDLVSVLKQENVLIVQVDHSNSLVFLQGAVPGPTGGVVTVQNAVKTPDVG